MHEIQSPESKRKPSFHPLADIFPLMVGEEFDELVRSIKLNGLRQPIVLFEDKILDGRNRARACERAEIEPEYMDLCPECRTDPVAFVIDANLRRRHLTTEQKRELIGKLLKANPERSNLQIAKAAKVDDKTVAAVRKAKEATSEIPRLEKTIGTDGKARRRPMKKKRVSAKVDKVNPLIVAWDQASNKKRYEFISNRKLQIMQAQQQIEKLTFETPDDGLDIPGFLRRTPVAAS